MDDILSMIGKSAVDILIYGAIAAVLLIGLFKCVIPVRRVARALRRATSRIERNPSATDASGTPLWQNSSFLGKRLECAWNKFLSNAIQLDARGLTCNVDDYINDDTTIYAVGHVQLSEVIPGLLTSLGILGTFIGLIRGLGGLDLNAGNSQLVDSIGNMISGMTFAFSTSVAGVACSLCFNVVCKTVTGSAINALDSFQDAFSGVVMQRPVDDSVRLIIQQEDQAVMLRRSVEQISSQVSGGIVSAVGTALEPVARSMSDFVLGKTQSQLEGLNMVVQAFIVKMNDSLSGELLKLGQTLSYVSQEQQVNMNSIAAALSSAESATNNLKLLQNATERMGSRIGEMVNSLSRSSEANDAFLQHSSQILSGMMASAQEQSELLSSLQSSQQALKSSMKDYADWSGRVLNAVSMQGQNAKTVSQSVSEGMQHSADALRSACAEMTGNFAKSIQSSMLSFDSAMKDLLHLIDTKLDGLKKEDGGEIEKLVREAASLQSAMREFADEMKKTHSVMKAEEK